MAPAKDTTENGVSNGTVPTWLETMSLEKAMRESVDNFRSILSVTPEIASAAGENYSSLLLRLIVEVELNDDSTKVLSFMLKAQHSNEALVNVLNRLKLFQKEDQVYHKILPEFEQLYKQAGKSVQFAPKAFKFDRDVGVDYVLLEDMHEHGYKNANRVVGLDLEHMQQALVKLAEFHAASACYVEHFGMFGEEYTVSVFSESNRALLTEFNSSAAFLSQLKKWKAGQQYYKKLADSDSYLVTRLLQDQRVDSREFNVLNHGDCWANNILYQYDASGKITSTLLIDFQVGKYGSPANDLYYLILSSAAMNIKLCQFDYMVRYYFDHLVNNLKLLQYHRPLPKLKNLHMTLLKNGLAAYMVVSKILPVVMLEPNENSKLENYFQDESKMKTDMYTNPSYVQAMTEIMPWLDNRGLLDWK